MIGGIRAPHLVSFVMIIISFISLYLGKLINKKSIENFNRLFDLYFLNKVYLSTIYLPSLQSTII